MSGNGHFRVRLLIGRLALLGCAPRTHIGGNPALSSCPLMTIVTGYRFVSRAPAAQVDHFTGATFHDSKGIL
jgi:hypothetical protein